ncbi:DUF547 domain-containing protein [Pseudothauera lacus]|uniref:DUF547 domain-containing protein n=1 Tax=Pseudothauera lacus TaxID=2136175 RepID=A0A2T4IC50_9RHOO|nr:DUF547 domain-containing protein [Pseudothauera lacus]PTD95347.1 DUF547 domain-containing protein [Pseudothauera lacus]
MRILRTLLACLLLSAPGMHAAAFDHTHSQWSSLLDRHVRLLADGNASQLDYRGMARDRAALQGYLDALATVTPAEYEQWHRDQRLAFLINAYNAWTVELVLGGYPGITSIKELGSFLRSPWKRRFIPLLGNRLSLDDIEHGMIRAPGAFDEPRIHFAVVCASVGCPMLRPHAYTADALDAQFEDSLRRFLADRTRNRFDAGRGVLQVSKIFAWYRGDFASGHRGFDSLHHTFARHADALGMDASQRQAMLSGAYRIEYLDYDWSLNDTPAYLER